jgi:hypothetical protein
MGLKQMERSIHRWVGRPLALCLYFGWVGLRIAVALAVLAGRWLYRRWDYVRKTV